MTSYSTKSGMKKVALQWARELYGISAKLSKLTGYDDTNFLLKSGKGKYVLKISDEKSSIETLRGQNHMLRFLQEHSKEFKAFPAVIAGCDGSYLYQVSIGKQTYWLRILTYL